MVRNNRDIIDFVGTPPFLRFALQIAMTSTHFHNVQTCVSFRNFFRIKRVPRSNLAPIRKCPKGARKATLDDIRSIGHLLTNFHKTGYYW